MKVPFSHEEFLEALAEVTVIRGNMDEITTLQSSILRLITNDAFGIGFVLTLEDEYKKLSAKLADTEISLAQSVKVKNFIEERIQEQDDEDDEDDEDD